MNREALSTLAAQARADMAAMAYPARIWMPAPAEAGRHNVLVVGGGQSGLGVAFQLARDGVAGVSVIDKAPRGAEGPWLNYARMATLRTPKDLVGLECGLPSLSVRSWYAAAFGPDAWDRIVRIPRAHWAAYLDWFRDTAAIPVRNGVELRRLEPQGDWIAADLAIDGKTSREFARRVVLAHGFENAGQWTLPEWAEALPERFRAHSNGPVDFDALKSKRVAVLGQCGEGEVAVQPQPIAQRRQQAEPPEQAQPLRQGGQLAVELESDQHHQGPHQGEAGAATQLAAQLKTPLRIGQRHGIGRKKHAEDED